MSKIEDNKQYKYFDTYESIILELKNKLSNITVGRTLSMFEMLKYDKWQKNCEFFIKQLYDILYQHNHYIIDIKILCTGCNNAYEDQQYYFYYFLIDNYGIIYKYLINFSVEQYNYGPKCYSYLGDGSIGFDNQQIECCNNDKQKIIYQEYIKCELKKHENSNKLSYELIEYIQNTDLFIKQFISNSIKTEEILKYVDLYFNNIRNLSSNINIKKINQNKINKLEETNKLYKDKIEKIEETNRLYQDKLKELENKLELSNNLSNIKKYTEFL